eukprot:CAMPEP_0170357988 /NCGR_PEP_ID=MMETSP0117_2-20130122/1997_1 /TAXON_ID=400756 /ORGANISM="Durinskia baltica, Strain CSIRO CS-38" /LENGTH=161 /DNA_ID=CAMNT_0010612185 /DNA_START=93 /DNA_END=578 /DNA_ORIENTATION=+
MAYYLYWSCNASTFQVPGIPAMSSYVSSVLGQSNVYYCGVTGLSKRGNLNWNACALNNKDYINTHFCKFLRDSQVDPPDYSSAPPCFYSNQTVFSEVAVYYSQCTNVGVAISSSLQFAIFSMSAVWIIFTVTSYYACKRVAEEQKLTNPVDASDKGSESNL